ncbi:hypothetical protein SAMN04487833_1375 [Sarcina sp. DSM 11001]|uniref:hypothetical protein n=1 Tax=Sarcina sp. DSM 11001 TaxID=1798184 RepID=UPI000883D964|nr:hypothetical protein [Sarcina sp. DSM 11001]SDL89250.1 hypothetical protein SAMN04487833_1375 [Sarcina sp. DSM 11001]
MNTLNKPTKPTKPEWHNGYIVTLNTLARFFPDTRGDVGSYCDQVREMEKKSSNQPNTYLTFGEFDRITFNGVNRFSRFFDLDERSKYWLGKHQSVFIYQIDADNCEPHVYPYTYEISDENKGRQNGGDTPKGDFGICINEGNDDWYLFSSKYCLNTEYQNKSAVGSAHFFPFFVFTQISLSNEAITRISDFTSFIKALRIKLREQIDQVIKDNCCNIKYEIFGCLNTSEICILWMTEQYTDVLSLIDELKNIQFSVRIKEGVETTDKKIGPLFFSFYSVIGRMLSNDIIISEEYDNYVKKIQECKGTAQIDIILNNECSAMSLYDELLKNIGFEQGDSRIRVGEHDFSIQLPACLIYNLFQEVRLDSPKNGVFKKSNIREKILGTRVVLSTAINDSRDPQKQMVFNTICFDNDLLSDSEDGVKQFANLCNELNPLLTGDTNPLKENNDSPPIRGMYRWLRKSLKKRFASHTGAVDTLDMLYTDYLSNIHESYNAYWRNDYNYQFKRSLQFLITVLESTQDKGDQDKGDQDAEFWNYYSLIIDSIRQQTVHFSQSSRLVMRIPSSHLRYTACCDLMFHGYYGLVKAILHDAYIKQTADFAQSELLPVITTNSGTNIKSKLFFIGPNCADIRIVQIDIPYSLLYDPIIGFPYMIHEMFHYIAPDNRYNRNRALGYMLVNEILTRLYMQQIVEKIKQFFYEKLNSNDDFKKKIKLRYNKTDDELNFKSENANEFEQFFISIFKACYGSKGEYNALNCLYDNLRTFFWLDTTVSGIREAIVDDITNSTDKKLRFSTWDKFLDNLINNVSELSTTIYEEISESLLKVMDSYDNRELSPTTESIPWIYSSYDIIEMNEFDRILYDHKLSVLNPKNLLNADKYLTIISNLTDYFINGLREATPDIAMVKYCHMDNVEYLVCYARQVDISVDKSIGYYEELRIPIVLIWNSQKSFVDDAGFPLKFDFEQEGYRFVKEYMAENLQQEKNEGKLVDLVTNAIMWFCKFVYIAKAFTNEYFCYYDEIINYGKSYEVYYSKGDETEREPILDSLVKTLVLRRADKIKYRSALLSVEQWDQIRSISEDYIGTFAALRLPNYEEVHDFVEKRLTEEGLSTDLYKKNNKRYNQITFGTSLRFVHLATKQITFEQLAKTIKRRPAVGSGEPEDDKLDKKIITPSSYKSKKIPVTNYVSSTAWGMTEFTSFVQKTIKLFQTQNKQSNTLIWYYACSKKNEIIPTVSALSNDKSIYKSVYDELLLFSEKHALEIDSLKIPTMTIEAANKKSSMIPWKGGLLDSLRHVKNIKGEINLFMFSPQTYLKARQYVLSNHKVFKASTVFQKLNLSTIPMIHSENTLKDIHGYYTLDYKTEEKTLDSNVINQKGHVANGDFHLPYILPMPLKCLKLEADSRFLAYNLALPSYKGTDLEHLEFAIYPLEEIQLILITQIRKILEEKPSEIFKIEDWTFLYKIVIDDDIISGIEHLIPGLTI